MYKKILLAYDGSDAGQQALLDCKEIAQMEQSELHLLAVISFTFNGVMGVDTPVKEVDELDYARLSKVLELGIKKLNDMGVKATGTIRRGGPVDEIVKYVREQSIELVVVGHKHKDRWIERWWGGSLSKALIEESPCSVLVVITH
jgi:nucleotide-binding universal stress UspA family protein